MAAIESETIIGHQHIVMVAFHHFFSKTVLVIHHLSQMDAVLCQPQPHVIAMLRVNDIVGRRQTLAKFLEKASQQGGVRTHHCKFHLSTLFQEFTNHRHATGRMPQSPIQRCYKDFQ